MFFRGEICDFAGDGRGSGETVDVEFKGGFVAANVRDGDFGGMFGVVSLGEAWGWCFDVVPGFGVVWWWGVED